ncbi:helix-turn-helix domain-containing protein [Clostridium formicaceticum]|uniref:Helix-turn-helix domain protein n=1 Tax=Clostridium formicaceticum TaxID=1497 RepID=A0AAC9WHL7_9CLOT|nr:helix-turn-helix transcriptional regulator [Clostridium formicaceticum]AOY74727.1 transcriptional regulator [Clostridium formicaceticum]ARE89113.1 Helix-turn-helix domain protein [Clostridium formicaceticum]
MQKLLQEPNVHIGHNLKRLREQRNLSQYDMERELQLKGRNMARATYAHIEQGRRNIFISDLILIKEILGVNYEQFFEGLSPNIHVR